MNCRIEIEQCLMDLLDSVLAFCLSVRLWLYIAGSQQQYESRASVRIEGSWSAVHQVGNYKDRWMDVCHLREL